VRREIIARILTAAVIASVVGAVYMLLAAF
jgi:hypothetical protein